MSKKFLLDNIKKIHFIGIGGISMSGLAEILLQKNYIISGSDMKSSSLLDKLSKIGITVFSNHSSENITNQDLVIYTAAIKNDNPELTKAKQLGIVCIERATLLGEIMDDYKYSIAVAGTHGKTTTTSMITSIMIEADLNPTAHIGAILPSVGKNTIIGNNEIFVAEACEYVESFLKFNPYIGIILNIDIDHLDYFKDLDHIKQAFISFKNKISPNGYLIANIDDQNLESILATSDTICNIITYAIDNQTALYTAKNIYFNQLGCATFTVYKNLTPLFSINLKIPGIHNVSNALGAIVTCLTLKSDIDNSYISKAFESFKGANRRFEFKGSIEGVNVVDDYAHHPTEIKATLGAAKKGNYEKIICVFQPHTYTRTKLLLNEFSNSFDDADIIIVTDIYAAREKDPGDIHSQMIVDNLQSKAKNALYIKDFNTIVKCLLESAKSGDLIITMGAGNVDTVADLYTNSRLVNLATVE